LCAFCVFVLFCVLFLLLHIAVSLPFLYQSTDRCHPVKNKFLLINIIYHFISYHNKTCLEIVYLKVSYFNLAWLRIFVLNHKHVALK
jgi:hypothetical protein